MGGWVGGNSRRGPYKGIWHVPRQGRQGRRAEGLRGRQEHQEQHRGGHQETLAGVVLAHRREVDTGWKWRRESVRRERVRDGMEGIAVTSSPYAKS